MPTEHRFVRPGMAQVSSDRWGRYYQWQGDRFFSVTTIIGGGVPKPVLVNWAKKFVAEYAINNIDLLNKKIDLIEVAEQDDADLGKVEYESVRKWLSDSPYRDRDKKADLGSVVHDYAEAYATGRPMPPISDAIAPYMHHYQRFLDDFHPEFVAAEAPVFSRTEKYAGMLDAIADFDPGLFTYEQLAFITSGINGPDYEAADRLTDSDSIRLLLDYKTGKGVYPEVALQLAAYRYADVFLGMPDGSEAPMPVLDGAVVLHLRDDHYELIPVDTNTRVYTTFLYAREIFRWARDIGKTTLGPTIEPPKEPTDADS